MTKQRITYIDYELAPEGTVEKIRAWWEPKQGDVAATYVLDEYWQEVVIVGNYARDFAGAIYTAHMDVPYGVDVWALTKEQLTPLLTVTQILGFLESEGVSRDDISFFAKTAYNIDKCWQLACNYLKEKLVNIVAIFPKGTALDIGSGKTIVTEIPTGTYAVDILRRAICLPGGIYLFDGTRAEDNNGTKYVRKGNEWVKEDDNA